MTTALPPPAPIWAVTNMPTETARPVAAEKTAQMAAPVVAMRTRLRRSATNVSGTSIRTMAIAVTPTRLRAAASDMPKWSRMSGRRTKNAARSNSSTGVQAEQDPEREPGAPNVHRRRHAKRSATRRIAPGPDGSRRHRSCRFDTEAEHHPVLVVLGDVAVRHPQSPVR